MRTPVQAILWELWRTSRAELVIRIAAQSALVVLIWLLADLDETQLQVVRGIAVMLLALTSVLSFTWLSEFDSRQSGFSFRLGFTRPANTATLVIVPLVFLVATAVACFLLPAMVFRVLLSPSFPLAGPAMWVAVLTCCLVAATWSAGTKTGKRIAIIAAICGCALALVAFHTIRQDPDPFLLALGKPRYFDLAWYESAVLVAVAAIMTAVTIAAVDRQRHDVAGRTLGTGWRGSLALFRSTRHRPFRTPLAAQCWYEMRRFGNTVLLLSVAAPLVVFAAVRLIALADPRWEGAPQAWLFAIAACPFAYQLIGADGALGLRRTQGATQLSAFDATRPLANDRLIALKMLIIAGCSLFGCLCMAVAAALHAHLSGDGEAWARVGAMLSRAVGDVPAYWWAIGACNAALLYVSSTSAVLAFGLWLPLHRRLFAWGIAAVYIHIFLLGWDAAHQWRLRLLWTAWGYAIAVAVVAACFAALHKAVSAGFLGRRLLGAALILWMIYVSSAVTLFREAQPAASIPLVAIVLGGALLLVPLATTAVAPLALAAHRHA